MSEHINMRPKLPYTIDKNLVDRLGGIMLTAPLSVGSMISVQGTSYRIYGTYMVKCRLFVSTGAISISYQEYRIYGTGKIKRFAMLIGLRNHAELAASFFNNCSIKDTVAEQTYIFHSFTEENIFRTWQ